ncbi:Aldehyde/histidinol dehydrogenase [Gorgonomyces haynaldii]|nr:Aldehyde/histidinol dehydrogenase [Gorgonomyces haynaldii]
MQSLASSVTSERTRLSKQMQITSPIDNSIYKTYTLQSKETALRVVQNAHEAQLKWKRLTYKQRQEYVIRFVDHLINQKDEIALELSHTIGRPRKQNYNEIRGFEERARYLISIGEKSLSDFQVEDKPGFKRYIKREPLGVVLVISAWNYPYLITVNSVIPSLLSGNTVILKHAPQTFSVADRFKNAFELAGLPPDVFQTLTIDHDVAQAVIQHPFINHVQFTGSVRGGHQVNQLASVGFCSIGLELGGKDPAYVREDADPINAAENLIDGAMYNSGQSCCGIERIYVHEKQYDQFVQHCVKTVYGYKLGNPLEDDTNLGPVVNVHQASLIRQQIQEAVQQGAQQLIDLSKFPAARDGTAYVAPQILVNVNHQMRIMTEETFGPVVGIVKVSSDQEAIRLMNDSQYGLTCSIWTKDLEKAVEIGDQIETGTVFLNRCDYLDPALAWVGVKDSGRGVSLSKYGFDAVTRPKSYHLRLA